jgi:hypothetical protein
MGDHPHQREHPPHAEARSGAFDRILALWLLAAFLGGLVGAHYLLPQVLARGSEMAPVIPSFVREALSSLAPIG